jgi:type III restriction enzyme
MKIKFDGNQDFQLDAIRSVVNVFAGQPLTHAALAWQSDVFGGELLTEMGVGNSLALSDEAIFKNVRKIQAENELTPVNLRLFADAVRVERALRLEKIHHRCPQRRHS